MFEAHVLHLLRKYLGEYVEGLSLEALRISVWKGDVVLKDLQLKAEALNALKLPVVVKAGFVGSITLKVPWKSLGKEPVIVLIDRVFVLAHPAPNGYNIKEEDREKLFEAKLRQIEEAESATLEAKLKRAKLGSTPDGNSWLGSLIATIIGNLKISITNVHIRYEDVISNPGHPFCCGVTLAKLAAITIDEEGNETFDTSGALDKLRKSLQLQRLAVYHDSDTLPWKLGKTWEDLSPREWIEIFEDGIGEPVPRDPSSVWSLNRKYLISPINGTLNYHRLGKLERKDPDIPFEKASLILNDVSVTVSEAQYHDGLKVLEAFSKYRIRVDVSHLRPMTSVSDDPGVWWRYAFQAGLQQKKLCYRFSWDRIQHLCQLRRRYIQLYASFLQQLCEVDVFEMREIEKDLDSKVILLWRLLAHAKVETKEAAQQKSNLKRSWWSFSWRSSSEDPVVSEGSLESKLVDDEKLTKEEWKAINKLLSYQPEEEVSFYSGKDLQNMVQYSVNIYVERGAARIISCNETEIVCGRFERLQMSTKHYHKSINCDVSLRFYGLSAPEGSLVQSVSSKTKVNALEASFLYSPVGENLDWRLSATIAPCHVTVLVESYNHVISFVRSSNTISPTIASETAAALQMKIEKVSRKAQEQLQIVLEEQSRFVLDVDFDAPKVMVPMMKQGSTVNKGNFLIDFGHFTLHTREGKHGEQSQTQYSRFYILGRDIAAFFLDNCSNRDRGHVVPSIFSQEPSSPLIASDDDDSFLALIDRCGMAVVIDQIKLPHPGYPSTQVSVQVPLLGIHFSPKRYSRLLDLINILYNAMDNSNSPVDQYLQSFVVCQNPGDLTSNARILVWGGIGNSIAEWKPCFLVLSGIYIYVLESELSQTYQRCASLAGRQVIEVSPASVGGSLFCLAVCVRGTDVQKALESSNTLILEFQHDDEKVTWLRRLTRAIYGASSPVSIDPLEDQSQELPDYRGTEAVASEAAELVVNCALVQTKIMVYGQVPTGQVKNEDETLILEVLAGGAKVNLVCVRDDLNVKMKLHSLKVKDELQSWHSASAQYLACSVLKNEGSSTSFVLDSNSDEIPTTVMEEDDIFRDALPDFLHATDHIFYSHSLDTPRGTKHGLLDLSLRSFAADFYETLHFDKEMLDGKKIFNEDFCDTHDIEEADFVSVTFTTRSCGSLFYDGIDTQMNIWMSKLDFYCSRPTLVALIDFGIELSLVEPRLSSTTEDGVSGDSQGQEHAYVKGLLGYGKSRTVFRLKMDVDSVCIYLNDEAGSQLAMFVQERFILDLKVHPSSLSIEGKLGNLRLCNMALGPDHCWGWLCDIRNQNAESLVEFMFQSYSQDDDDYEGVDYSLSGRLSAVRIVFLYKFVQEIAAYFMELATPHTEEAIKFVDKVGGFEWLIQKYEIEGAPAIKLDISLDTPIIIIPRNSTSNEFMQLDLGQLELKNNFSWHGSEKDTSSVHLDTLEAEIHGINMAVGAKGSLGKPMIRRGEQISIKVCRSLRDVFRKVPTFSLEIKVGLLHAVMSDKEYNVILDCLYMNLLEEPSLPPSFRSTNTQLNDSMRLLADKVNLQSQILLSRTVSVMVVEVTYALLELCNGIDEESPLAHLALEDLWVSYRTTSLSEVDLYMTIPKFSVLDVRPGSKPEMQLMLGSASDLSKQGSGPILSFPLTLPDEPMKSLDEAENLNLSMLLVDYRVRSNSESFVIRIQQPRILVVLDFLLGLCEFFVPALGSITGHEETLDPRNDPLTRTGNIVLSEPVYEQEDDVIYLSSNCQLIVDSAKANEFVYDGGGKKICLVSDYLQKEVSPGYIPPVIIIGRGKKLRFKNVIIENGTLMSKCTYLGNGSSYSVSVEDGVHVSLVENSNSDSSCRFDVLQETSNMPTVSSPLKGGSASQMRNFTFEAQVVSPEFTFYDSTKLSSTQALHVEKLLRAKLDLSFMYAFKESDTWVRAFLKDVTIESGSGLVVLDPVDIYGGFTSVKDKTNIYVASTDICLHLSLSVISLVLHLQDQANAALQYGNAKPLATCINFDRIWVSPKAVGNECGSFFAFWRPQAPPNYVILSDCVTSRPTPPSQAVMAVSNIYGRVKKPIGFELIGFYSSVLGYQCDAEDDCSLWLPIAPLGYSAVGCVANKGRRPPSNHVVFCLRTDLLTSTTFSECYLCVPPVSSLPSGFSIWRVDNALGSFIAHFSVEFPAQMCAYELHQMLFANQYWPTTSKNTENFLNDNQLRNENRGDVDSGSAGWEVLRSISKSGGYCISTPHFERIWWDKGCDTRKSVSIWRPIPRPGFSVLGDCITEGLEPPALGLVYKCDNSGVSAHPIQFTKVAYVAGRGFEEAFFWYPIAPPGYTSMGCVVSKVDEAPRLDSLCCPRMDLVQQANVEENPISRSMSSKISNCWSIWKVENQAGTFLARSDLKKPSNRLAYSIGSFVKPRTREDISGEMKLPYFSLTILDSLYGMTRPLCDITITNMNLASHGCMESMNAVLVSSIAASTFNTQLEAWEPFIEPFDGIFKFETYETDHRFPLKVGKKVRIAATSILNFNFSAANLDTIAESILSWKRQRELEWKSTENEEPGIDFYQKDLVTVSALKEDEFQKLTVENKLGCDIYLKKYEDNSEVVALVRPDECASALLPPQRFSDRLNVVAESKNSRCYIAIHIYEARGLQLVDDGNSHDFFCAVRLVVDGQSLDQRRLFSQSARTRAVKPLVIKANEMSEVVAKWNEVFIFEVPKKGLSRLEVEVTNLASRAGKGEVIGAFSISVGNSSGSLKRVPSVHLLNQSVDIRKITAYPLERRGQISSHDGRGGAGVILVSTCLLEKKASANFQRQVENVTNADNEVGFWIGLHPEGPWESFRSVLPLSVAPRTMDEHLFAFEVVTKNGKKHAILRSLGVVVNDTDVVIEVCLCPVSAVAHTALSKLETNNAVLEEVFENQHYHPVTGWRSKLPGSRDSEPQRWSTRNFSFSSKDFFEPPIPPGWQWVSGWTIEKSQYGDSDGWIYGPDYVSLKWPPSSLSSSKLSQDCVRRRRWIRPRKKVDDKISDNRNVFARINPKSSTVLPWKSMFKDVDVCLQFRPHEENSQTRYMWAHSCLDASAETMQPESISGGTFKLNKLEKKDLLFCSTHATGSNKKFWLSVGADASVLQTELNSPVYDWKISVNAPLKLENKLPSEAEYSVWEGTKDGKMEKQRGVVSSGSCVLVYSVDVQRPIYLNLYIKGGWILEKDPIPILDFSSPEHVSYFWMVNQQKKRRLRVSIERDLGASNTAAKTIRFYVPYWIANDTSLSLVYRMVEVDSSESAEIDSSSLSRTVKSAKLALKRPTSSPFGKTPSSRKNIQILETIDESDSEPIMLSPHEYLIHNNILSFSPRNDSFLSPRIGLSVALRHCEHYSSGISLLDLENKEKTDVKAINSDGSYYKLSVMLKMVSNRTKVIHFRPQTVLINRTGCSLFLQQVGADFVEIFQPTDPPKVLQWQSSLKSELLKLRLNDFRWSSAFSIQFEGAMCLPLKSETGSDQMFVRVEVRSGTEQSRYEVIFRPHCFSSPYRIENRSAFLHIHVRQVHGADNSWQPLSPNSASPFFWEDLGRQRLLEISVDGNYSLRSQQYNIDEVADHQPIEVHHGPTQALRVTVDRVGKINVVRISDWMPVNEPPFIFPRTPTPLPQFSHDAGSMVLSSSSMCEIHFIVEVAELGLSVVDHTPEEILYLSLQNVLLSYSTGLGSGISRFKLRVLGIQLDNQLPLTPMPVLFRPQRFEGQSDYVLKFSVTMQSNGAIDLCAYPYIGLQAPENLAFLINVHEPIIWRLHEMIQYVKPTRISSVQSHAVSVDPTVQIRLLNVSEIRFKISLAMSPSQRPRGVLGFWSSLMTALGNTENMTIKMNQRFLEDVCMRQSALISAALSNIQKDLLSQPLQLLSGVDILGNASSALGHMSKGVAALSMDKKFIQSRQRQENKGVEAIGDVIREGGGAFAKGLFRGVTGILTKPLEGAKSSGVEGFVQGVGKGIIGAAAQPVSGVLDLLSKTTEGANAMRMKIMSAITSEEQLLRRRLPRVIGGDNLLRPYNEYNAQGQVILQLAECGSFFGQVDLFKVRGKFALSDAYENHFMLPEGKIVVITHRRVLLLQQPANIVIQRKFNPVRDPCAVLWDVSWDDLSTMEIIYGKKDDSNSRPSQLVLYLHAKAMDSKDSFRVLKCNRDSQQAFEIYCSIDQALSAYGPKHAKDMLKKKVLKPYAPRSGGTPSDIVQSVVEDGLWSLREAPSAVSLSSTFGTVVTQPLSEQREQ